MSGPVILTVLNGDTGPFIHAHVSQKCVRIILEYRDFLFKHTHTLKVHKFACLRRELICCGTRTTHMCVDISACGFTGDVGSVRT